ncbi:ATP-binding protein [Dictyobacter arantiisoli]|nr:ATP-binding protein [Dictyobacter arantiisoli]
MKKLEYVLFLGMTDEKRSQRYILDALIGLLLAIIVTVLIYIARLYPLIPNISFLYLLVVLGLATVRGLYAAVIASLVSFISFDFFLVPPVFTFSVSKYEEWLALFIFLVTAFITGQLASALRQRAEQALMRERESRALYDLVNATTNETHLDQQLDIVAHAILNNFATSGVRDCALLLPDEHGRITLRASAVRSKDALALSSDELRTAESVLRNGRIVDFHGEPGSDLKSPYRLSRVVNGEKHKQRYTRLVPLHQGQRVVGVLRLLMADGGRRFPIERALIDESTDLNHQATFFWTFLDQAAAMIERANLQREALQIELLQRTDVLRSALLSSVSHDLRTPLSSIKAAASSLLQEDVDWDEEARKSFAVAIEREADRLNRLVGNILDMSRIEGGALKAEKEWYPLDELIHDVLGHMKDVLQGRDIVLQIPDDLPPVQLDYLQIDQVLTNLIENAIRYTMPNSPLEITVEVVDHQIMVSIADHGTGIPPYDLERIFDKFYRVSGAKRKATSVMGTGLGLAVCRGLIEAHGGHIWAANRPEGGAIFRFTLPLEKIKDAL